MNKKLDINLIAAKMLGYNTDNPKLGEGSATVFVHTGEMLNGHRVSHRFNIFDNPADTLAVVKMLGEKHNIFIAPRKTANNKTVWYAYVYSCETLMGKTRMTYEAAVGAAVMFLDEIKANEGG